MSSILYLRTGSGSHIISANLEEEYMRAVRHGDYIGFYHELRQESVSGQITCYLRQIMGKRCDARPALEVSQVLEQESLVMEALERLRNKSHVDPVLYSRYPLRLPSYLEGYPVWISGGSLYTSVFLMPDRERIVGCSEELLISI